MGSAWIVHEEKDMGDRGEIHHHHGLQKDGAKRNLWLAARGRCHQQKYRRGGGGVILRPQAPRPTVTETGAPKIGRLDHRPWQKKFMREEMVAFIWTSITAFTHEALSLAGTGAVSLYSAFFGACDLRSYERFNFQFIRPGPVLSHQEYNFAK